MGVNESRGGGGWGRGLGWSEDLAVHTCFLSNLITPMLPK